MQQIDVLDRRGLSVFSLKPHCAQVMASTAQLRSTQESFTWTSRSRGISSACFLAVLLLWCPCVWVCVPEIHHPLGRRGCMAVPVPCSDVPQRVCVGPAHPARAVKPASPGRTDLQCSYTRRVLRRPLGLL